VDSDIASDHPYHADDRRSRHRLAAPDQSATQPTHRLRTDEALIVILAVSLGLWAAIAAVIRALARVLVP
jgi:hypothetical protein